MRRTNGGSRPDYELLDRAIDLHDAGEYAASLAATFAHLFPDHRVPDLAVEEFVFVQGSSRVAARLADGMFRVRVPLVRLSPDSITTAALRFVLSTISSPGQLYQPCLRGEDIYLEYSDRLERLHPYKIREVLRRMPVEADTNDDWMVAEFKCAPLDREPIEELTDEEFARAETIWRSHWDEVDELVKESQRKRSGFFLNEITAYAIHHIGYALPLTGYWWSRITSAADTFNDTNQDPNARESALTKCVKEMRGVTPESLRQSLGHAHYAISPLVEGTPKILTANIGPEQYLDTILQLFNGGHYMEAAVGLIGTYNYLLARFSWSPAIEKGLADGLALASGRPWREAAANLLAHSRTLVATMSDETTKESAADASQDEAVEVQP